MLIEHFLVSISSTSQNENIPWYSEQCASTIASTYSSGTSDEKQIMSTDLRYAFKSFQANNLLVIRAITILWPISYGP